MTRIHIKPALGKTKFSGLNPLQVQSFYRFKLDEGLSAATDIKIHSTLSKSLKQAVRWRLIPLNVCESVTPPRKERTEIDPLDAQQVKALLKAAEGKNLHALWTLLATTGLRIGEALALRWDDLDMEARTCGSTVRSLGTKSASPRRKAAGAP